MKKNHFLAAAALLTTGFASPTWAVLIGTAGPLDTCAAVAGVNATTCLVNTQPANNGDTVTLNWLNGVLGTTYTSDNFIKWENNSINDIESITDTASNTDYAFNFGGAAVDFYLIKQNNGGYYLLQNIGALNWGAFDVGLLGLCSAGAACPAEERWSYIGGVGRRSTSVPEPMTLGLLGLGLAGLGLARRRRKV